MSGGTPVAGGYMRQRHSQGYASSGDDIEDDACSRFQTMSFHTPKSRTWIEVVENVLWLASAAFIVYYGDKHSNMIYLLWHDGRIRRLPLYLGMVGIGLNIVIFIYTSMSAWSIRRLSFALWPIWGFLTIPLLFTMFMACMVVFPNIMIGKFRPQSDFLRTD
ncbi:transmembrane protein 128-like protein [Cucumis melo var. makuwa]|uniref:Transmembrane protein 128-like protein n=1 Tax=Cucumis melo var. makuwa TaxID=1194695 RepID=A0A5D3E153_CUCMM|nr:transmembrane protein 128-like protein [Cucumis melo var. makuwa]